MFGRAVLAIELSDAVIRAAVVTRSLLGCSVSECVEVSRAEREAGEDAPLAPEDLSALTTILGGCPKNVVLVSPGASAANLSMDRARLAKMKPFQIKESLRWEAEPYTGMPAAESMAGYEVVADGGHGKQTQLQVAVFGREEYGELKEMLAAFGLKLKRVYPGDACFPVAVAFGNGQSDHVVAHVNAWTAGIVGIRGNRPVSYSTAPVGMDAIRKAVTGGAPEDAAQALREPLLEATGKAAGDIVVCGPGGTDPDVVRFIGECAGMRAAPLSISVGGRNQTDAPMYAAAIGAGLRELGFGGFGRTIGVTDAVPLSKRVRDRIHVFPVVAVAVVAALFLGHYLLTRRARVSAEGELPALKARLKEIRGAHNRFNGLKNDFASLRNRKRVLLGNERFLNAVPNRRLEALERLLTALAAAVPADMSLDEIRQDGENRFVICGRGLSVKSINGLAAALQRENWCVTAALKDVSPSKPASQNGAQIIYECRIELLLRDGGKQ